VTSACYLTPHRQRYDKRTADIIIIIIIINTSPSQCMKREMSQCYGIKQYTQTEKLQQIGQI
jgi:hypothetical protein